jgi:uncharacterized membrane protein
VDGLKAMNKHFDARLEQSWSALRITFAAVPILAGLDKYFDLLANWPVYVSPVVLHVLPLSVSTLLHIAGIVEILVGIVMLTRWQKISAYIAAAWLVLIAINLVITGHYFDVAVRDLVMALAAFVLGRLTEVRLDALNGVESADI